MILAVALQFFLILQISGDDEPKSYLLLTKGLEEICNAERLYLKLLEWVTKTKNTVMVEPFVCDSYVGGLPGWAFGGGLYLFNREVICPLKPWSWYRDMFSGHGSTLRKTISYNDFLNLSSSCDKPPSASEFTEGVLSGNCLDICLLVITDDGLPRQTKDLTCSKELLDVYHLVEKQEKYGVVDPINGKETSITMNRVECWNPNYLSDIGGISVLINKVVDMKNRNMCRTASLALHRLGKVNLKDTWNEDWGDVDARYSDIKFSQDMIAIADKFKKEKLAEKYIAVQLRALKPSIGYGFDVKDEEGIRICFQKVVDRTIDYMKKMHISKVFLAADVLARDTSGEHDSEATAMLTKQFNEIVYNSGVNWITNLESDPFASEYRHDRGAQGMIDQIIAIDSEISIINGYGAFSNRILNVRKLYNRETIYITCEPSDKEKERKEEEKEKEQGKYWQVFSIVWLIGMGIVITRLKLPRTTQILSFILVISISFLIFLKSMDFHLIDY
jgi:uncharacterized LabA/DUF88 family protein